MRLEHPRSFKYNCGHSTPGREGTYLSFDIYLTASSPDEFVAALYLANVGDPKPRRDEGVPRGECYAVHSTADGAILKLVTLLRRAADGIEKGMNDGAEILTRYKPDPT